MSNETAATKPAFKSSLAGLEDAEALERLVNLAYRGGQSSVAWKNENHLVEGPRVSIKDLQKDLARKDSHILKLQNESGNIVACVQVECNGDEAHIGMLAVDPGQQNLGLGKKMLLLAEEFSIKEFSCSKGKMCVFAGRQELLAWYAKMGYRESGETIPFFGPESGLRPLVDNAHFVVVTKSFV